MKEKHLLVIHPGFCIRAQKQVEALLSKSTYKITIITDVNKSGDALSDYIKNVNIYIKNVINVNNDNINVINVNIDVNIKFET